MKEVPHMRRLRVTLLFSILTSVLPLPGNEAQIESGGLQVGVPVERTIASGQAHGFTVNLEADQFLRLVVDQRGVDVVVRVFSPAGKSLGEFDSPNGTEGPENVSFVAATTGVYRISVAPLDQVAGSPAGRYEIKILEIRHATDQEMQASKREDALKGRGLALLTEIAEMLKQIQLTQTRVRAQLQAAQLLWPTNEKAASKLVTDAIEGAKAYLASIDIGEPDYNQNYQIAMDLRRQVVQCLAPHDPETALSFLRSTHTLVNPNAEQNNQPNQELQLELSIASQITVSDPKRALQIAEDSLKKGYSSGIIDTLARLRTADPDSATKLAKDVAAKLLDEKLLTNPEAANLAVNLLRIAHLPARSNQTANSGTTNITLLSNQEFGDLLQKALAEGLSYKESAINPYSVERNSAQSILNSLKGMAPDMETYLPGSNATIEKRVNELNTPPDQRGALWQRYQNTIGTGSIESGLEIAARAPREMRDQLYQQVAGKAAESGDFADARQILTERISNPVYRRQALNNLEQQAIYYAVSRGRTEEAVRSLANLPKSKERNMMLSQIVDQIGRGQKIATALNLLELARSMVGTSVQAEDQEQMIVLLAIGRAFSRYDSKRGFEVVEPLVDQFNEMSEAAVALNGFGQQYYQDGELIMQNGNSVANTANIIVMTLGSLTFANFDRAKAMADKIHAPGVRFSAYLAIAQQAIQGNESGRSIGSN
jgi:hypothetical protein